MSQAITVKYLGATPHRGSRIKASAKAGSITLDYNSDFDIDKNHIAAAQALASKYGWRGRFVGGWVKDGTTVFVNADDTYGAEFRLRDPVNTTEG